MVRLLLSSAFVVLLLSCSDAPLDTDSVEYTVVQAYMDDPGALARGQAIFEGSCASFCHAMERTDEIDASFLFDCQWNHGSSDQEIFDVITTGVPGTRMVGFGSNFPEGDEDLWKVIAYLRSNQQAC